MGEILNYFMKLKGLNYLNALGGQNPDDLTKLNKGHIFNNKINKKI